MFALKNFRKKQIVKSILILSLEFDDENKTLNAKCKQGLQKPKLIEIFFTYFSLYVCLGDVVSHGLSNDVFFKA